MTEIMQRFCCINSPFFLPSPTSFSLLSRFIGCNTGPAKINGKIPIDFNRPRLHLFFFIAGNQYLPGSLWPRTEFYLKPSLLWRHVLSVLNLRLSFLCGQLRGIASDKRILAGWPHRKCDTQKAIHRSKFKNIQGFKSSFRTPSSCN